MFSSLFQRNTKQHDPDPDPDPSPSNGNGNGNSNGNSNGLGLEELSAAGSVSDSAILEMESETYYDSRKEETTKLLMVNTDDAIELAKLDRLDKSDHMLLKDDEPPQPPPTSSTLSSTGLKVLILLAVQNCSKNILLRYVMKDRPDFLTSAAVLGCEMTKMLLSVLYILFVDRRSLESIYVFLKEDFRNMLLLAVPAAAYNLQMSLEYVALANLNAAVFSVLVQIKLLATAIFAAAMLRTKLKVVQIISLLLLTVGVMLINIDNMGDDDDNNLAMKGVMATLGIAISSGFASVYTEKVIKTQRGKSSTRQTYSLAYVQVQLALASVIIMGLWAIATDYKKIMEVGLWHNFTPAAYVSIFNSAIGGLIVAAVLKYADSVLKGYATAISVVLTGVTSMVLFDTQLNAIYVLGIINVVCAVLLYNAKNLERPVGCYSN